MVPHKIYPKYLLAKLYDIHGQQQEANGLANENLTSEVKVMSTAINEIRQEMLDILNKQIVELGNKEWKVSRTTQSPSTPSSHPNGKEV